MGSTQSKLEKEEAASRFEERKQFMKETVFGRNAFAAAHSAYAVCLKDTGAALSDYTRGEYSVKATADSYSSIEFPPPPPLPLPLPPPPPLVLPPPPQPWEEDQGISWDDYFFAAPETMGGPSLAEPEPEPVVEAEEKGGKTAELRVPVVKKGGEIRRRGTKPASLMQIFADVDDHFLKAFESAQEVSGMLEVSKFHFDANFADNRGHIDSNRVMRVITWNRSLKGIPILDEGEDDFDSGENSTYSKVLDKMIAWEKDLYDEVKACETMKHEYQEKVALLSMKEKQGSDLKSSENLESVIHHLHMRYIVNMQSLDSTIAHIYGLRDEQLYSEVLQLLDGMATMWETMRHNHDTQARILDALKSLDRSQTEEETSTYYRHQLTHLLSVVREWYIQFCRLIDCQKDHVRALHNWLSLNLVPVENCSRDKMSSPRDDNAPIRELVKAWNDAMDELPDEIARSAIRNFASVVFTIIQQDEKTKLREKCEATRKELDHKSRQYEDWCLKNGVIEGPDSKNPLKTAKEEREIIVISLRQQLEDCQKLFEQVREKSSAILTDQLFDVFRAMSEIAQACSVMYRNLRLVVEE